MSSKFHVQFTPNSGLTVQDSTGQVLTSLTTRYMGRMERILRHVGLGYPKEEGTLAIRIGSRAPNIYLKKDVHAFLKTMGLSHSEITSLTSGQIKFFLGTLATLSKKYRVTSEQIKDLFTVAKEHGKGIDFLKAFTNSEKAIPMTFQDCQRLMSVLSRVRQQKIKFDDTTSTMSITDSNGETRYFSFLFTMKMVDGRDQGQHIRIVSSQNLKDLFDTIGINKEAIDTAYTHHQISIKEQKILEQVVKTSRTHLSFLTHIQPKESSEIIPISILNLDRLLQAGSACLGQNITRTRTEHLIQVSWKDPSRSISEMTFDLPTSNKPQQEGQLRTIEITAAQLKALFNALNITQAKILQVHQTNRLSLADFKNLSVALHNLSKIQS